MRSALGIYQENLDQVSAALWDRDLDLLLDHIGIPNRMATSDREIVISSREEMLVAMNDFRDFLADLGATEYRRVARSARFAPFAWDTIMGAHDTFITRNGEALRPPIAAGMTLLRIDGRWKGVFIASDIHNALVPYVAEDMAEGQARDRRRLETRVLTEVAARAGAGDPGTGPHRNRKGRSND